MPVPFSEVVKVNPGVLAAAGSAVDLNAVVLTQSQYAPQNEVLDFSTAAAVAAYFGATSAEADIASGYFQGPDNALATPGLLKFLGYAESAVGGWLLGRSLASLTLTQLQALSGTLIITVGGVQFTSGTINFGALGAPTQLAPSTSTTGGTLPATTPYYFKIVATNASGSTLPSAEETITTGAGATNSVDLSWNAVPGATGYEVWFGTAAGTETAYFAVTGGSTTTYSFTTTTGSTSGTIPASDTTAVSSFSAAASEIQAAFTAPTFSVAYDALHSAFMITTTATGSAATITYCTGTLAAGIGLDSASGGTLSQGAAVATPATQMDWLVANDQNWASFFTTWESQQAEQELFAAWSAANSPRYAYISWDEAVAWLTPNNASSFGGYLKAQNAAGTLAVYGLAAHATLAASWAASLNFGKLNGRTNLCFRTQAGLAPAVTDDTSYNAVISNGANVYAEFGSNNPANDSSWFTPGTVSGAWAYADTYFNQIWINANLQLSLINLLKAVGQLPYNRAGDSLIKGACQSPITQFGKFGGFRTGAVLSASQIQQITNLVGTDVSSTISAQGYYLYSNAASTAAPVQQQRGSPPIIFIYWDGGSVQSITLPSYVITG